MYSYETGKLVCSIDVVQFVSLLFLYSNIYFAIPDAWSVPVMLVFTVTVLSVLLLKLKSTFGGGVASFHASVVLSSDIFPALSIVLACITDFPSAVMFILVLFSVTASRYFPSIVPVIGFAPVT